MKQTGLGSRHWLDGREYVNQGHQQVSNFEVGDLVGDTSYCIPMPIVKSEPGTFDSDWYLEWMVGSSVENYSGRSTATDVRWTPATHVIEEVPEWIDT